MNLPLLWKSFMSGVPKRCWRVSWIAAANRSHLGYGKYSPAGKNTGNSRNGVTSKKLKSKYGEVEIEVPRDRAGTF